MHPGAQLTPTLELVREIGRGAMGSVWEARNTSLGTLLAVKLLRADSAFSQDGEARFEREIEVLAALDHPHLVRIVDRGKTADGGPFFVMEYLRGEDLGARLAREGTLSIDDTVTIVSQACRALAVAHERGIVHRDIKPANLFLLDDGGRPFVKVLDFGIAKRTAGELGMTSTGISVGTPYFMSPEQFFTPSTADQRADLWALGVVAYACLTGAMPFTGETPSAIGLAAMQHSFTPVSRRRGELGPGWDNFSARALNAEPAQRFQSALELAEALRRTQADASALSSGALTSGALTSAATTLRSSDALAFAPTAGVAISETADSRSLALDETLAVGGTAPSASPSASATQHSAETQIAHRRWQTLVVAVAGLLVVGVLLALRSARSNDQTRSHSDATTSADAQANGVNAEAPVASNEVPSAAPSAPPSESSVPLVTMSAAPSAEPSAIPRHASASAAPQPQRPPRKSNRVIPSTPIRLCWTNNDGAIPGNPGVAVVVALDVTPSGKVERVQLNMLANKYLAFRGCATQKLSEMNLGPGEKETIALSLALPPSPNPQPRKK